MTISETYAFLKQPRKIEAEIHKKMLKRDALRSCLLPSGIRYDLDKVLSSPADQMSEIEAEVIDLSREIAELKAQKAKTIVQVSEAITRLDSDLEQEVLLAYYLAGMTLKMIGQKKHYSPRGVGKIKQRAVLHLSKKVFP